VQQNQLVRSESQGFGDLTEALPPASMVSLVGLTLITGAMPTNSVAGAVVASLGPSESWSAFLKTAWYS
jgi:hypothetical protein